MTEVSVEKYLKQYVGKRKVFYKPNPGNAGDSLIAKGTLNLFAKLGLDFEFIDNDEFDSNGKVVLYGGGGNLVGMYHNASRFIDKHHSAADRLILLPHTIANSESTLSKLSANVTIFVRESTSYEYVKKVNDGLELYLDNDMAFHVSVKEALVHTPMSLPESFFRKILYRFTNDNKKAMDVPSPILMLQNYYSEYQRITRSEKTLYAFRSDEESANKYSSDTSFDLSHMFNYGTWSKPVIDYASYRLLKFIDYFEEVETDRLHVCIASALLGKQVKFYPNSYYKNKAVYEYSLKDKYTNVRWMGD